MEFLWHQKLNHDQAADFINKCYKRGKKSAQDKIRTQDSWSWLH